MEALQTATVRVVAVIAEGVPEKDTKRMIAFARANNKVIIGPATVGGVQVGVGVGVGMGGWVLGGWGCWVWVGEGVGCVGVCL